MDTSFYKILTDAEVVNKIVDDKKSELFEVLYHRYEHKVLDKCYSLVKNKQLAKEFTEDIFTKSFEKLSTFNHSAKFSSWLYSITYNYCIDYLRIRKKMHYPDWNKQNEIPEIIDETEDDFTDMNYQRLLDILELIHPEEKALLLMKYQDELSLKQIAPALRISEDAAKMRLKRARTRVIYLYRSKYGNLE
ncbi:MAG: sigma-70 family RNA polymerase sigma factor [Salinivirgaceae bacterium]|jgi:RNA polymerase sigma-70 factor (ECF subfamily)